MWKMIQTIYLGGFDGAGRITLFMMIMAFIVNFKSFFHSTRDIYIWGIWIIYVIICSKIKGFYSETNTFANWFPGSLVLPLVSMQVTYQAIKYDCDKTLNYIFFVYVIFVVIGAFNMGVSARNADRQTNELGNYYFNNAILLATYSSIAFSFGKIRKTLYYVILALVLYEILISGERKGLACVFIIVFGSIYALNYGKGAKSFVYTIVLAVMTYVAMYLIMEYSVAGSRMAEGMSKSVYDDNLFLKMMGDRGIMYYEGWQMFLENMWTGIGIKNFCWENSFFYGLPLHTEYMVQLSECGICGSCLFLLFYYSIIKKLYHCFKSLENKSLVIILISTMLAIVIINFVSWTYSYSGYFIVFGLIIGLHQSYNNVQMNNNRL